MSLKKEEKKNEGKGDEYRTSTEEKLLGACAVPKKNRTVPNRSEPYRTVREGMPIPLEQGGESRRHEYEYTSTTLCTTTD